MERLIPEWLARLPAGPGRLHLRREGPLAELTLDQPGRHNAVSAQMMVELGAHVATLEAAPPLALVLQGAGGSFCSGGDLSLVAATLLERGAEMSAWMTELTSALVALPSLRLGLLQGPALGGGAELLTICDHVVAERGAVVGFVQARLGVSPGWGGGARLVERVGRRRATLILAEARRYTAEDALSMGIVDEVVEAGEGRAALQLHLDALLASPVSSVAAAMELCRDPRQEARIFATLWGGADHRAALARRR